MKNLFESSNNCSFLSPVSNDNPSILRANSYQSLNSDGNLNNDSNQKSYKRSRESCEDTQGEHTQSSASDLDGHQPPAKIPKLNSSIDHNAQLLQSISQNPEAALNLIQFLSTQNSFLVQSLSATAKLSNTFFNQYNDISTEIEKLRVELAKKEKECEEKQTIINHQSNLIEQYVEIKGDLTEKLFLYEQTKPPPHKVVVLKKLEKTLLTKASRSLLVDFVIDETDKENTLNQVGRIEVDGRKQHRHIIPHAMLTKTIETAIKSETKANLLIANLSEIITAIYNFKKNICLTEKQYLKLTDKDIYFDKIITTSDIYYFIDAEQYDISYDDIGTTAEVAEELFKQKYKKHIVHDLEKLAKAAGGDVNTTTMVTELLIKFIYTIFNQNSIVSYPDAGNSRNYEIRLFEHAYDAENPKNKEYKILTHSEVAKYFKDGEQSKISKKIRIVNNEGDIVKKSIAAFELFNSIINCGITLKDDANLINEYNTTYNKILKLENLGVNLEHYNKPLTKDNLESQLIFHIVKYLYFSLDLKPLEEKIFVPSKKGIKIYNDATTKTTSYFDITNGINFRDDERKDYKDKIPCRKEQIDKKVLGEKIHDEVSLLLLAHPSFDNAFNNKILEEYYKLCSLAHNIDIKMEDFLYKSFHNSFDENSIIVDITGEAQ